MWIWFLVIAIVIGAIIGLVSSKDGEKGEGALQGGCFAGAGCITIMMYVMIFGLSLAFLAWLFDLLFG